MRLAETPADIEAAQALRYRVFYQEMGAHPTIEMAVARRDFDDFDAICDHLLVIDQANGAGAEAVVGTYRLIRRDAARAHGRFYTADEYDISRLEAYPGEILELGRSCVEAASRNRATMQLLWRGIAAYVFHYGIELMFGCASLPGTDPDASAVPLSYLYHHHLAPPALRAARLARALRRDEPARAGIARSGLGAAAVAAADQGLSAAGRFRRRRRGDRSTNSTPPMCASW